MQQKAGTARRFTWNICPVHLFISGLPSSPTTVPAMLEFRGGDHHPMKPTGPATTWDVSDKSSAPVRSVKRKAQLLRPRRN
jgi:hypothetical protein